MTIQQIRQTLNRCSLSSVAMIIAIESTLLALIIAVLSIGNAAMNCFAVAVIFLAVAVAAFAWEEIQ